MRANAAIFGMIVAVPFLILSGRFIHEGHQVAFAIFSLALISSLIKNRPIEIFGYYVAGYVAVDFIRGILMGVNPAYPYASLGILMFVILGMLLVYAVMISKKDSEFFFNAICILSISQMAIALVQSFFGYDPYTEILNLVVATQNRLTPTTPMGTMGNNNFMAGYLAMSFPFFLRKKWVYALPILVLTIYLCKTSTAIAAFGCAAAYYLWGIKKYRWYLAGAAFCFSVGYVLVTEGGIGQTLLQNDRWLFWRHATEQITSDWWSVLFGKGLGGNTGFPFPLHNEWVQTTFHLGLVGIGIVVWFFATIRTGNRLLVASVIAIMVECLGSHPMHLVPSAILILCVLALAARDGLEREPI